MQHLKLVTSVSIGLLLAACSTNEPSTTALASNTPNTTKRAAVLSQASTQARLVINKTISSVLRGTKVSIAKNAFVNSSQLTLQQNMQDPRGMKGLNGRLLGSPVLHHFSMVKQSGSCYLIDAQTSKRHLLSGVNCKPVSV